MRRKVYLESSFISYLTSRLANNLIIAGHQLLSRDWWDKRRASFDLFISQSVLNEIGTGDPEAAKKRMAVVSNLPILSINDEATELAIALITQAPIPEKAGEDALHIALAAVYRMDFLLTWNCRHIANAEIQQDITQIITASGYRMPIIATPEELMGW